MRNTSSYKSREGVKKTLLILLMENLKQVGPANAYFFSPNKMERIKIMHRLKEKVQIVSTNQLMFDKI